MLDFFQGRGRVHLYSLVWFVLNSGRYGESQAEPSVIWSNASGLIAHPSHLVQSSGLKENLEIGFSLMY